MSAPLQPTLSGLTILPPIASLTDDALSIIFELVFSSGQDIDIELTASFSPSLSVLKLSHVSRQFALATHSNPHLWTHISGLKRRSEMKLANACLECSRKLPLTIILYVYVYLLFGITCDPILEMAKPHAPSIGYSVRVKSGKSKRTSISRSFHVFRVFSSTSPLPALSLKSSLQASRIYRSLCIYSHR
ncbi:hypothetical protein SCHPADRAFT_482665 [Schizopora paradoxa]|uniref:F-box domain-containing protein n=1 Tax=Schizopora paradoxa TaxID=27342 RepID=A0A0H2RH47_9AGAM|nr:hypothetical protein SCHPADRAFT_482665 [Schizopora paradoxa]